MSAKKTTHWYLSKTLIFNVIAALAILIQSLTGYKLTAEVQGAILVMVNLILRSVTNSPLGK